MLTWRSWTRSTRAWTVDALRDVATAVNGLRKPNKAILLITHYQRLLDYMDPDFVHIMVCRFIPHPTTKFLF